MYNRLTILGSTVGRRVIAEISIDNAKDNAKNERLYGTIIHPSDLNLKSFSATSAAYETEIGIFISIRWDDNSISSIKLRDISNINVAPDFIRYVGIITQKQKTNLKEIINNLNRIGDG